MGYKEGIWGKIPFTQKGRPEISWLSGCSGAINVRAVCTYDTGQEPG